MEVGLRMGVDGLESCGIREVRSCWQYMNMGGIQEGF